MEISPLWNALERKHLLLQKEHFSEIECVELDHLEKTIATQEGYAAESQAAKLLEGLGLSAQVHLNPSQHSFRRFISCASY